MRDLVNGIIKSFQKIVNEYTEFKQIKDLSDSYVVNDDVEIGMGSKIPLWLFGFLY